MKTNAKPLAIIAGLWALLGLTAVVRGQTAPMAPRATAPKPAAMVSTRPVAPKATPKPAAMVATRPVARRVATAPKPAVAPAMAPEAATKPATPAMVPEAMKAETQPTMAAAPADAKPKKKDSKGSVVGGWALELLLYILSAAVTAIVPVLTGWAWNKWKLDKYAHKDLVDEMVLKGVKIGIGKAEEQAYKLRDNPMTSAEKLDVAIKSANKYLQDSGLVEKGADYLADLIESELGHKRPEVEKAPTEARKEAEEPNTEKDEAKELKDKASELKAKEAKKDK